MPHPPCPCAASLDRRSRCDLLLGQPDLHLTNAKVTDAAVVLDGEACDPLTGCAGCGVIATGHGRVTVALMDAPVAGRPTRLRWRKHRWICPEPACPVVSFLEQSALNIRFVGVHQSCVFGGHCADRLILRVGTSDGLRGDHRA